MTHSQQRTSLCINALHNHMGRLDSRTHDARIDVRCCEPPYVVAVLGTAMLLHLANATLTHL